MDGWMNGRYVVVRRQRETLQGAGPIGTPFWEILLCRRATS
jgi:hypothetical protein